MQLLYYALKYQGDYDKIKKALQKNEYYEKIDYNGLYVTIHDANYPTKLKALENPPYVLFYKGNLSLLNEEMICVVGSRNYSEEGKACVQCVTKHPCVFISGLAKGIDAFVHEYSACSVGVIGCGIDTIYPKENAWLYQKTQLIISEYPGHTKPLKHHFPMRNRIMVALASKICVIEGAIRSGTMSSLKHAMALGKEVYVFPKAYNSTYTLNNLLIKEGAMPIIDEDDIYEMCF